MAHLDANTLIGILQGRLGDIVFAKTDCGRVMVRHRPLRACLVRAERSVREWLNANLR